MLAIGVLLFLLKATGMTAHIIISLLGVVTPVVLFVHKLIVKKAK